ncbi:MAG: fucose isomerase, partial [Treponema sp.]|nr:fucose isomerase [Treponema sp.]
MNKITLGYAPTRRSIFSAPDALKYRNLTKKRLEELGIRIVDIDDLNSEGLFYDINEVPKIIDKFSAAGVDGLFFPHCNFGTEYAVADLARKMNLPVLLWGPRDERPDEAGIRLRDSQCGLFATG